MCFVLQNQMYKVCLYWIVLNDHNKEELVGKFIQSFDLRDGTGNVSYLS